METYEGRIILVKDVFDCDEAKNCVFERLLNGYLCDATFGQKDNDDTNSDTDSDKNKDNNNNKNHGN